MVVQTHIVVRYVNQVDSVEAETILCRHVCSYTRNKLFAGCIGRNNTDTVTDEYASASQYRSELHGISTHPSIDISMSRHCSYLKLQDVNGGSDDWRILLIAALAESNDDSVNISPSAKASDPGLATMSRFGLLLHAGLRALCRLWIEKHASFEEFETIVKQTSAALSDRLLRHGPFAGGLQESDLLSWSNAVETKLKK
eukprot:SAG31_NODE_15355_length_759_cov_0.850000_1_plen_198_part_10